MSHFCQNLENSSWKYYRKLVFFKENRKQSYVFRRNFVFANVNIHTHRYTHARLELKRETYPTVGGNQEKWWWRGGMNQTWPQGSYLLFGYRVWVLVCARCLAANQQNYFPLSLPPSFFWIYLLIAKEGSQKRPPLRTGFSFIYTRRRRRRSR